MAKTLLQRYAAICRVLRTCAAVCGCDVTAPNYRMNGLTFLVTGAGAAFIAMTLYTVYLCLVVEKDWPKTLQALCMFGTGIQGYCKLFNGLWNRKSTKYLMDEMYSIYEDYQNKHADYRCHLNRSLKLVTKIIIYVGAIYFTCTIAMILLTFALRAFFNKREFVLMFIVPGMDPDTEFGYVVTNLIHISCLTLGVFGIFAADMYFFLFVTHAPLLKNILSCKFHDLNEILDEDIVNLEKSWNSLKDILNWHQKYISIISIIKNTYFWVLAVQISSISLGIVCTLFCILMGKWPGGFLFLFYSFVSLYIFCGLGTMVELANDGVINSCYNDVKWYKLSLREQKMLKSMLMAAQTTKGLTVGDITPLSMNTGLQVTKAIYTWTMMMINYLD